MRIIIISVFICFFIANANAETSLFNNQLEIISQSVVNKQNPGVTSLILIKDGELLSEVYSDGVTRETQHDLRSVTKSITSLLVGIAIETKLLAGVESSVTELAQGTTYQAQISQSSNFLDMSVQDLLTMRTGLACDDWVAASVGHEDKMYQQPDWAKFILSLPKSHDTGKHFSYCTGGAILMGHLIEEKLKKDFVKWADESLFGPLKIDQYTWAKTPYGNTDTGGHLKMRAIDLAKIGQLMLAPNSVTGGVPLSRSWIRRSTERQTSVYERRFEYGYWWWKDWLNTQAGNTDVTFAWGNGGQYLFIVPEYKIIAVFTGTNYNSRSALIPQQLFKELLTFL